MGQLYLFYIENASITILRNVDKSLPIDTASRPTALPRKSNLAGKNQCDWLVLPRYAVVYRVCPFWHDKTPYHWLQSETCLVAHLSSSALSITKTSKVCNSLTLFCSVVMFPLLAIFFHVLHSHAILLWRLPRLSPSLGNINLSLDYFFVLKFLHWISSGVPRSERETKHNLDTTNASCIPSEYPSSWWPQTFGELLTRLMVRGHLNWHSSSSSRHTTVCF